MSNNIEETLIFCVFCRKEHKLEDLKSEPFFETGKAYFCGEEQIARSGDNRVVYWNGGAFSEVKR